MYEALFLNNLKMNHFTELDAELYCQLSLINPKDIIELYLEDNKLTDISGISIFKNLNKLYLDNNQIRDLSSLKNLNKLEILRLNNNLITDINILSNLSNLRILNLENLNLTDEKNTVKILKNLPKLKYLYCENTFKTVNITIELKGIKIYE